MTTAQITTLPTVTAIIDETANVITATVDTAPAVTAIIDEAANAITATVATAPAVNAIISETTNAVTATVATAPAISATVPGSPSITHHGDLSGLGDDDHTQYLNTARADAILALYALATHTHLASQVTDLGSMALQNSDAVTLTGASPELAFLPDGGGAYSSIIVSSHLDADNSDLSFWVRSGGANLPRGGYDGSTDSWTFNAPVSADGVSLNSGAISATGLIYTAGSAQFTGTVSPSSGAGVEVGMNGTIGYVQSLDRDTASYGILFLEGDSLFLNANSKATTYQYGSFVFNNSHGNHDVVIRKQTSGDAYWFDADADTHYFYSTIKANVITENTTDAGVTVDGVILKDGGATLADSAALAPLNITERSAAPTSPAGNDLYLDDGTNTASGVAGWRRYTGAAWEDVGATAGGATSETFETVAQNHRAYPSTISWSGDTPTSVVYDLGGGQSITKTINYTGENITSIVLSGDTPAGISLTKTYTYTGSNITGVSYS